MKAWYARNIYGERVVVLAETKDEAYKKVTAKYGDGDEWEIIEFTEAFADGVGYFGNYS